MENEEDTLCFSAFNVSHTICHGCVMPKCFQHKQYLKQSQQEKELNSIFENPLACKGGLLRLRLVYY